MPFLYLKPTLVVSTEPGMTAIAGYHALPAAPDLLHTGVAAAITDSVPVLAPYIWYQNEMV